MLAHLRALSAALLVLFIGAGLFQATAQTRINSAGGSGSADTVLPSTCNFRLTTESGVPVSTSDRTAQGTIYATPYQGNICALYSGTAWAFFTYTERSLALAVTSGNNYDVFLYNSGGTGTLELSAAWASDTARTDAITLQDGVYVKSGATTRRLLGTIRASGANVTQDTAANRWVWNVQNRVPRQLQLFDATASWTYAIGGGAAYRQARATATNQVSVVTGLAESAISLTVTAFTSNDQASPTGMVHAVAEDSTTAAASTSAIGFAQGCATCVVGIHVGKLEKIVPLGYHFYPWVELTTGGTMTVFGLDAGSPITYRNGLSGWAML